MVQRPHTQWQCAWRAGCQPQTPFPPLQPSSAVLLHPQPLQPCWQHPCCHAEPSSHSLYARIPGDLIRKQAQQVVASIGMSKTQPCTGHNSTNNVPSKAASYRFGKCCCSILSDAKSCFSSCPDGSSMEALYSTRPHDLGLHYD